MEKFTVVGYKKWNFNDEKTGQNVSGALLILEPDEPSNGFVGKCYRFEKINFKYVDYEPVLGDYIRLIYNQYGKIGAIEAC